LNVILSVLTLTVLNTYKWRETPRSIFGNKHFFCVESMDPVQPWRDSNLPNLSWGLTTRFSSLLRIEQFSSDDSIVANRNTTTFKTRLSGSRHTGTLVGWQTSYIPTS
jgi:hypothetical protein